MATHVSLGAFDCGVEEWTAYCERLEQYFLANDVEDAGKQRAILLSVCGAATYRLIRNLVAPDKPTDKSFAAIVKLVQDHYTPPPSVIVQRFKFHSRSQKDGESIAEFVANYDGSLSTARDVRVQRHLLAETDLAFKKAFELSQAAEVAEQNAKDLHKSHATTVHTMPRQSSKPDVRNCYRCGGKHAAATCRFKDTECHYCHKQGHLAKVCRAKLKQSAPEPRHRRQRTARKPMQHTL